MNRTATSHVAAAFALAAFAALAIGSTSSNDDGTSAAATAPSGCQKDTDCKGNRVCMDAQCVDPPAQPQPLPLAQPQPAPRPAPRPVAPSNRAKPVSDPPGGCTLDGVIYERSGTVWGCEGGGNWCSSSGRLPGGCPAR